MTTETQNWWTERWLTWCRAIGLGPQTEGQARSAQRLSGQIRFQKGRVTTSVWVSERRRVESVLKVRPWGERDWRKLLDAIAAQPDVAQRLLSGRPGAELEEMASALGLALFPQGASVGCGCGSGDAHCRHMNYLVAQTAVQLGTNPFFWFEVLGQERQDLIAAVRDRLVGTQRPDEGRSADDQPAGPADDLGDPLLLERFWEGAADPAALDLHQGESATPDALLRSLGPLPVAEELFLPPAREPYPVHEILRRMVTQVGRQAIALAEGEAEPVFAGGGLPGKAVSTADRLLPEVAAVLQADQRIYTMDELYDLCPTAQTLGDAVAAHKPLLSACRSLPPGMLVAADRYVGTPAALLEGAVFHHVVTFDEWRAGEGAADADWFRALAAAGKPRPSLAPYFRRLEPQVGDLLRIRVDEGLHVERIPRADRETDRLQQVNAAVARLLQALTGFAPRGELPEQELVAALLAEGGYRDGLHPDPLWLVALLAQGLYNAPADRTITRQPNSWRPGFARFVYGFWPRRDDRLRMYQARLMKRWVSRQELEAATACIGWWNRLWPGAQDEPGVADSLGSFLHFLWNVAPREARRHQIPPEMVPALMEGWFAFLAEAAPSVAEALEPHRLACGLQAHYQDRLVTAPPEGAPESQVLAWQAEGFRWIGPTHLFAGGGYR